MSALQSVPANPLAPADAKKDEKLNEAASSAAGSSSSAASSSSSAATASSSSTITTPAVIPTETLAQRRAHTWAWTPLGFGEVIHLSRVDREAAKAREIAATLVAPTPQTPITTPALLPPVDPNAVPIAPPIGPVAAASSSSGAASSSSSSKPSRSDTTSPSTSLTRFLSIIASSSEASSKETVPRIPLAHIPPSNQDDTCVVHLLPHHTTPNPLLVITGGSAELKPTKPTLAYVEKCDVHTAIRVRVTSFFPYASLIPAAAPSSTSTTGTALEKDGKPVAGSGLVASLGREIRERKAKMDQDRAAKAGGGELTTKEKEAENKLLAAQRAARVKPTGPPPQSTSFIVPANTTLRAFIEEIVDFYSDYNVRLDPDAVRLVSNGREISRSVLDDIDVDVKFVESPSNANKEVEQENGHRHGKKQAHQQRAAPAAAIRERDSQAIRRALSEALWLRMNPGFVPPPKPVAPVAAAPSKSNSFGGGAAAAAAAAPAASSFSGAQPPSQVDRDRYLQSKTMLAECGLVLSTAPFIDAPSAPHTADAKENGNDSGKESKLEEEKKDSSSTAASSPSSSSSSSITTTSTTPVPTFDLLMVYDELSRFSLDSLTCPSDLSLGSDQLSVTMMGGDNRWLTVRSTSAFTSGRHQWKVHLDKCTGGNIFLGVCTTSMLLTNYLGHCTHSFGYYGCGNIYRSGSSSSYGSSFRTGDTILCKLDMDARTLSFEKNDQPLGVAFADLPATLYPAMSLYAKNDHIRITEFGVF